MPYKTGVPLENSLLIIENAHLDPHTLRGLSYFSTTRPDLWVIATGNYPQALAQGLNPSAVEHHRVTPLIFAEYLNAVGDTTLSTALRFHDVPRLSRSHTHLLSRLNEFLTIGGMPQSVSASLEEYSADSSVHDALAAIYSDIQSTLNKRSRTALDAIGAFLAEDKPYHQSKVRRAGVVTLGAIEDAQLCHRVPAKPHPRTAPTEKIYLPDVGLLALQLGIFETPDYSDPLYHALYSQWLIQELRYQFPENTITYDETFPFILHTDDGPIGIHYCLDGTTQPPDVPLDMQVIHLSPRLWEEGNDSRIRTIPLYDAGQISRYVKSQH